MGGTLSMPPSTCVAVVTEYARRDGGQLVVEGTLTMPLFTCVVVVTEYARRD